MKDDAVDRTWEASQLSRLLIEEGSAPIAVQETVPVQLLKTAEYYLEREPDHAVALKLAEYCRELIEIGCDTTGDRSHRVKVRAYKNLVLTQYAMLGSPDTRKGKAVRIQYQVMTAKSAEKRKAESIPAHKTWQKEADEYRERNPGRNVSDAARYIKRKLNLDVTIDWISKVIKK